MNFITTIPKAGTNYISNLIQELEIPIEVGHYLLDHPKYRKAETPAEKAWVKNHEPLFRNPNNLSGKRVVIIRDLRDVIVSASYWVERIIADGNYLDPAYGVHRQIDAEKFHKGSFSEKIFSCIQSSGTAGPHMKATRAAIDLVLALMSNVNTLVIRFEDIIGERSGGHLSDEKRSLTIQKMCAFLGYNRSISSIDAAIEKIWGNSLSYNPVVKKVDRWKDAFNEAHIRAFQENWNDLNVQLGYSDIKKECPTVTDVFDKHALSPLQKCRRCSRENMG